MSPDDGRWPKCPRCGTAMGFLYHTNPTAWVPFWRQDDGTLAERVISSVVVWEYRCDHTKELGR